MKYSYLFKPGQIGPMTIKNRLVMPPMVRNYATTKGEITEKYLNHLEAIAKGGTGLLILEASFISSLGKGFINELGIDNDKQIPGLKKLVEIAHKYNAKIGPQLYHAGRQTHHNITGSQPLAPSPIPCPTMQDPPHELTIDEIIELENFFASAAHRAQESGFDFVEIHGAHGYLITQFLSPFSNKRKDKYGGNFTNRFRFLNNIILKTKAILGDNYPIIVRLSGDELTPGGLGIDDTIKIAKELEKLNVHALHISAGNYGSYNQGYMIPPMATPEGPLVKFAAKIKKAVKLPIITVGKIHTPELANQIIKDKSADFVAIGRALLADPNWPKKVEQDKIEDINMCITCNQGCISRLFAQQDVHCTVNPLCGFENELSLSKTKKPKNIFILGGGPAGLYSAIKLSKSGHKVTLYDSAKKLGGQLNSAEMPPFRDGISNLKNYLINQVQKTKTKIILGVTVDEKLLKKEKPDILIVATGSTASHPPIDGIDYPNVIISDDIFTKKLKLKKKIIIAGGGCQGAQVADLLSSKKHNVTIVELSDNIALEMPTDEKTLLMARLKKNKVKIHTQTKIVKIDPNGVVIQKPKGKTKLMSDQIIICFGRKSNDEPYKKFKKIIKNTYKIGDCNKISRITEAISSAANLCKEIN